MHRDCREFSVGVRMGNSGDSAYGCNLERNWLAEGCSGRKMDYLEAT